MNEIAAGACEIKFRPINQIPVGHVGDVWLLTLDGHQTNGMEKVFNGLDQTLQAGKLGVARFNINEMRFEARPFTQRIQVPLTKGTLDTLRLLGVRLDGA